MTFNFLDIKEKFGSVNKEEKTQVDMGQIVVKKEVSAYQEDLEYLIADFAKLKSRLRFEILSDDVKDELLNNFEKGLVRFQKRYNNK